MLRRPILSQTEITNDDERCASQGMVGIHIVPKTASAAYSRTYSIHRRYILTHDYGPCSVLMISQIYSITVTLLSKQSLEQFRQHQRIEGKNCNSIHSCVKRAKICMTEVGWHCCTSPPSVTMHHC